MSGKSTQRGHEMEKLTTVEQLRDLLGSPRETTKKKVYTHLSPQAKRFIASSPFLLLATTNADGDVTSSPKGDPPGFVHVADERTLYIPERKGNRLIFSLQNILATGRVGLIFLRPNTSETLRISGTCELIVDQALCQQMADRRGNPALLVMKITVTESYFHCAKALLRSGLWKPESWPDVAKISFAEEIAGAGVDLGVSSAEFDCEIDDSYAAVIEEEGIT